MKGMRVQSIIRELRGEKIDIIEYSAKKSTTFAEKALQPAKVSRVSIADLSDKQLEVIVDDTQLSLAIGKKGQNVRLAAKLLGWKIDIKSEEEKRQEVEQQMSAFSGGGATAIEQVAELGEQIIEKLVAAGITTVEALADMTPEQLEEIPGIGEKTLEKISVAVRHYFGEYEEGEERPAQTAPAEGATGVANEETGTGVDLSESSVYGKDETAPAARTGDLADEATIDRLEEMVGGSLSVVEAPDESTDDTDTTAALSRDPELKRLSDQADAEAEEEIDALKLGLTQEDERPDTHDGSGRITDEVAEERLAEVTEVGPSLDEEGAKSLTPGRDDTSAVLAEHHPNTEIARAEAVIEGNLDEPRDERREDVKVDEGAG